MDLSATAEVYQRLAAANDTLNLSQERLINISRTLNQAVIVSGVSAETAGAALVQFGQGLASSELRGQELRSVLEQLPRLAQLISDDLGVTRGDLLRLGAAGQLTSTRLIQALENQAGALESEFGRVNATVGQSFTVLGNSLTRTVGQFSEATGAADSFAQAIISLSQALDGLGQSGFFRFIETQTKPVPPHSKPLSSFSGSATFRTWALVRRGFHGLSGARAGRVARRPHTLSVAPRPRCRRLSRLGRARVRPVL